MDFNSTVEAIKRELREKIEELLTVSSDDVKKACDSIELQGAETSITIETIDTKNT
eukprot:m.422678 g.422678  ORF g.422678 m.422678 type:complete len:56 (-) comp21329_c1_seq12:1944-2111(-)